MIVVDEQTVIFLNAGTDEMFVPSVVSLKHYEWNIFAELM